MKIKAKMKFIDKLKIWLFGCPHLAGITLDRGKSFECAMCSKTIKISNA